MTQIELAQKNQFTYTPGFAYRGFLILLGILSLVIVVIIKSKTITQIGYDPLLLGYTLFVTVFQLSRLASAMLYKRSLRMILPSKSKKNSLLSAGFTYEPTVSFVIPCKNEEGAIHKTIAQCFAADYPKEKLEVIVINDGSTDGTGAILRELKKEYTSLVVVDWKVNRGKRHGMAAGFRLAKGEIVVQLDSDSYIVPETFRKLIEPFENPEIGGVCAHADPENASHSFLTKMQAAYYFMSFRILKAAESTYYTVFCLSGCSSAYRKEPVMPILEEWLHEEFLGKPVTWGDDRALTNRLLKSNYKTIYTDEARAKTIVPENFRQLFTQQIRWKKGWFVNSINAAKFILRHDPFVALTYFYPLILVTLLTPIMVTRALFYNLWAQSLSVTLFYILGVYLVTAMIAIYYRYVAPYNKHWPYLFAWTTLNMILLCPLMFYALITIQNRKWGTR